MSKIDRETMTLMVECEDCKTKFRITPGGAASCLNHKKEFIVNGKSIFLTYYDCPSCGRRHFVQIDDATSLTKLREVTKQFVRLSAMRHKGKDIPQKQSAKFKKARQNLSDYRMNLMKEFTGKLVHDNETDSDVVLRFSV